MSRPQFWDDQEEPFLHLLREWRDAGKQRLSIHVCIHHARKAKDAAIFPSLLRKIWDDSYRTDARHRFPSCERHATALERWRLPEDGSLIFGSRGQHGCAPGDRHYGVGVAGIDDLCTFALQVPDVDGAISGTSDQNR